MKPIDRADQTLRLAIMILILAGAFTVGVIYFTMKELCSNFKLWRM